MRLVLIRHIGSYLKQLTVQLDSGELSPKPGDIRAVLDTYYAFRDEISASERFDLGLDVSTTQATFGDLSSGKDLQGKFAGHGDGTEHKDWKSAFGGASTKGSEAFLLSLFDQVDALAVARASGEYAISAVEPVYVTADGVDLQELIDKTLVMGVAYAQATDKYLDEKVDESDNAQVIEGDEAQPYSDLEHAWDEAFGYFGAARDYGLRSDDELAATPAHDSDGDGKIDLKSEMSFPMAVYAAKRDQSSQTGLDLSGQIWRAFLEGRALIAGAGDTLDDAEHQSLVARRDTIITAWEKVVAANVIHYLNAMLTDLSSFETGELQIGDLAKHFGEMKGFALGLQFNPAARISESDFATLHELVGSAPVLPSAGKPAVDSYREKLRDARSILQEVYEFDPADMGDEQGAGGL
jgi:hypothetical protein